MLVRIVTITSAAPKLTELDGVHSLVVVHRPALQTRAAQRDRRTRRHQQDNRQPPVHRAAPWLEWPVRKKIEGQSRLFFVRTLPSMLKLSPPFTGTELLLGRAAVDFDFGIFVQGALRAALRVKAHVAAFRALGVDQLAFVRLEKLAVGA